MLGETYEYIDNILKLRYFSEQVSHHPSIGAYYAEGIGYNTYGNTDSKYQFHVLKGSFEFTSKGRAIVNFEKFNEIISYTKPHVTARNLIFGKLHLDVYGKFTVNNETTGDTLELEVMDEFSVDKGRIIGEAKDIYGDTKLRFDGNWQSHVDIFYEDEFGKEKKERIWEIINIEGDLDAKYYFSDFVINLNNLNEDLIKILPPSDSRFRPDQRALENQELDKAAREKYRLEEKQRAKRKEKEKLKIKQKPLYFDEIYDDMTGELIYKYKGDYFKDRNEKKFDKFPDIF